MKNKDVTIYGYQLQDLVDFASICRAANLEPREIKNFNEAVRKAYFQIHEVVKAEITATFTRATDRLWADLETFEKSETKEDATIANKVDWWSDTTNKGGEDEQNS